MTHPDPKNFFIGKLYDLKQGKITDEEVLYNPSDLTTHAVVTGMTGSGKTGLCIGILEEAALKGLPAIIIDPKGDLTNLILHFPELAPADFEPWIDPDSARLKGKSKLEAAQEAASSWSASIDEWGLSKAALVTLKEFGYMIYSPGSAAGMPVNILSSFEAPSIPWKGNEESLGERISSTITAVLGLVGMNDIDPLRSREHILLCNILENSWSDGIGLTLIDLIMQTQKPPMERLGAFPMDKFFPEKDRFELAMLLNNFLASPSFQVWQQGQPLDIEKLLYTADGKPRHSIFYLSHLSENERMFFVTLLFSAIESWMRKQRGTSGLRALVYFDEILGYLPPVANPPSRGVLLRMIKQARAFGVGLLLATQNPVDLDYKALSNIGTWFIGRLQTERDKMRLMDGLETLTGGMDASAISDIISSLGKRVFLMNNVNRPGPKVFHARQVLNYLAGPLSRDMLTELNKLAGASPAYAAGPAERAREAEEELVGISGDFTKMRPVVPSKIDEFFIPVQLAITKAISASGLNIPIPESYSICYSPSFIAQAEIRYTVPKFGVNKTQLMTGILEMRGNNRTDWAESLVQGIDQSGFDRGPELDAMFAQLPGWFLDPASVKENANGFTDWLYRNSSLSILTNENLKLYDTLDEGEDRFLERCRQRAKLLLQDEMDKLEDSYKRNVETIEEKVRRQEGEVELREQRVSQHTMDAIGTAGSTIIGMLMGRKRSLGSSITKTRMSSEARSILSREKRELEDMKDRLEELKAEHSNKQEELTADFEKLARNIEKVPYSPKKSDIFLAFYGLAWLPNYMFKDGNYTRQVRAFSLRGQ